MAIVLAKSAWLAVAVGIVTYTLLHVTLVVALLAFGLRAGGFPLQVVALGGHATATLVGAVLVANLVRQRRFGPSELALSLAVAFYLSVSLAGAFLATATLNWFDLRTEFPPYLDDDGAFAWSNLMLALVVAAVSLATGWRGLLVGCMAGQGLALLLNPGFLPPVVIAGLPDLFGGGLNSDWQPFLGLPLVYAGTALALGWQPQAKPKAVLCAALALLLLAALAPAAASAVVLLATPAGLPLAAWRLRGWTAANGQPSRHAAAGAALVLLTGIAALSWRYLGLGDGGGDNYLPRAGQYMGWIGKTVPVDAYGLAGEALTALRTAYPWLLGLAGVVWAADAGRALTSRQPFTPAGGWLPRATIVLAAGMIVQVPWLFYGSGPWMLFGVPVVRGMAASIPMVLGEEQLSEAVAFFCLFLGFAMLAGVASLHRAARWRPWLALALVYLTLTAAVVLSLGSVAGTIQELRLHSQLDMPEFQQQVRLRLALSLALNAGLSLLGGVVAAGWLRRLAEQRGRWALPRKRLVGSAFAALGVLPIAGALFWHLTAMPVAETYPVAGATGVPLNAPVIVRLEPGQRNWAPGVSASYPDGAKPVQGYGGGSAPGVTYFVPAEGWHPNTRVDVKVVGPSFTRNYTFSFVTGDAPSTDVPGRPVVGPR